MGFVFKCYGSFKTSLGKLDAVVECNEIAVRELRRNLENNECPEQYLSLLSNAHGVRVNLINMDVFQGRVAQFYILSVFEQFEKFLDDFRAESPDRLEWKDRKGESRLDCALRNIGHSSEFNKISIGVFRYEICEYYRMVRNRFMHAGVDDQRLQNHLDRVIEFKPEIKESYKLDSAPNMYPNLTFSDFVLYSRTVKNVASCLCEIGRPSDSDFIKMILELAEQPESKVKISKLAKFRNNPMRLQKAVENLIRTRYSLDSDEGQSLVTALVSHIQENMGC